MKKLLVMCFILFCINLNAQEPGQRLGKFHSMQSEYIMSFLKLDDDKRDEFKQIYSDYVEASQALRRPEMGSNPPHTKGERPNHSDSEIEQRTLESFDMSIKAIEVKRDFYPKFRTILSARQVADMYKVEQNFRDRLIQEQTRRNQPQR